MRHAVVTASLIAVLAALPGCGKSEEEHAREEATRAAAEITAATRRAADAAGTAAARGEAHGANDLAKGLQDMAAGLQKMGGQQVEPVGFRELQKFFPELEGWERGKPTGEKVSMGIKMSRAEVHYAKGDQTIEMELTDSSLNQAMIAPFAMMLTTGYEKETDDGFERSAKVGGQPGWEKWEAESKTGELNAVVAKRFIVKIDGTNLGDLSPLHELARKANLGGLADLK